MNQEFEKKQIPKKSEDFSGWYNKVILKSELADYAPVRGCQIFRPYGFSIWENIKKILGAEIEESGVEDAYFPLFVPHSLLEKEKEHVKGFSPELAVVTHGGGKELKEPLAVRPTSETIMYKMFSKWIRSWRDLPFKINQWCNIVRWEKRTYLFLRTMEFLWQEGHTVHATHEESRNEQLERLKMYREFIENILAIPVLVGRKSESEKFPGALVTGTLEALMPDGKALQGGTAHDLGQHFSKPFEIQFQDKNGELKHAWQTSWGLSTRIIGALIMIHGDDNGLVLPPKIAPTQVVIVPIFKEDNKKKILSFASRVKKELREIGIEIKLDDREQYTPGWKFNEWELKGVPLRIEIGPKEVENKLLTVVRRDTGENLKFKIQNLKTEIQDSLDGIQDNLYKKAKDFLGENTHKVTDYEEFKEIMRQNRGFIRAFWCEDPECETKIKEETKATTRLLSLDAEQREGECVYCGKSAEHRWLFAQAY